MTAPDLPRITVVGLGPAVPDLVTTDARAAIAACERRFARTDRHPAVGALGNHVSFDDVYDRAQRLDAVYATIVDRLLAAAVAHGEVLYAVPGSPHVAERTVQLLVERAERGDVAVDVRPALSFLDLAWARLGVDPLASGVRLVDGQRFAAEAAGERGPLLVAQCESVDTLSDIKLAVDDTPDEVVVLARLGLPEESVRRVAWDDLDRAVQPDHLTSLWIPRLAAPVGRELIDLAEVVATLREQCPWDREQTHHSLRPYLLEETYEVLEALDAVDPEAATGYEALEEELGDLLFQVYFHAVIAGQAGRFTLADVAAGIAAKLVRRHPHVFGDVTADDADAVAANWEALKAAERQRAGAGPFAGVPAALPALAYAQTLLRKGTRAGTPPPAPVALEGVEVGEVLLATVAAAAEAGIDAEQALRDAANRYRAAVDGRPS